MGTEPIDVGVVSAIHVHPIKSCRAIALDAAIVSAIGLTDDRLWQVVDGDGHGLTQRQHRVLATVQPALLAGGGLRLSAPGTAPIDVSVDRSGLDRRVTVLSHFGLPVAALDAGDTAAAWFSDLVGAPVRLVAMEDATGWRLPDELDVFGQSAPFSDAAPILVTTEASLTWLRDRATEEFGMDRFRPNLVVSGTAPWEEDTWASFRVGDANLRAALPWPRCAIPQIDQVTAEGRHEPAKVLRRHRWCTEAPGLPDRLRRALEGNALFGIACSIDPPGTTVRIGDRVTVASRHDRLLPMAE